MGALGLLGALWRTVLLLECNACVVTLRQMLQLLQMLHLRQILQNRYSFTISPHSPCAPTLRNAHNHNVMILQQCVLVRAVRAVRDVREVRAVRSVREVRVVGSSALRKQTQRYRFLLQFVAFGVYYRHAQWRWSWEGSGTSGWDVVVNSVNEDISGED